MKWSVVIITRNEEVTIGDCLRSVVRQFDSRDAEIVLVDSASTDETVPIASQLPVRVIQLSPNNRLGPTLGREIGRRLVCGELILFMDGDSILQPEWITAAEAAFQADEKLAGVAGDRINIQRVAGRESVALPHHYRAGDYDSASKLSGCAAYRSGALEQIGGFNPHLYSCEEAELGARLRKAGWSLRVLDLPMTRHHIKHQNETGSELLRRLQRKFPIGLGQFARHSLAFDLPTQRPLANISRHLVFFLLMFSGLLAAGLSLNNQSWTPLGLWLLMMTLIFLVFCARSGSIGKPAYYFADWALSSPFVVWGLLKSPKSAHEYDLSLENLIDKDVPVPAPSGKPS